jgi:hypothetical protein
MFKNWLWNKDGGQRTEIRGQRAEDRKRRMENGEWRMEDRGRHILMGWSENELPCALARGCKGWGNSQVVFTHK